MSRAVLVDTTKCMGCRGCQVACKQANGNEAEQTEFFAKPGGYQNPPDLSAKTFSLVTFNEVEDERGASSGCSRAGSACTASSRPASPPASSAR